LAANVPGGHLSSRPRALPAPAQPVLRSLDERCAVPAEMRSHEAMTQNAIVAGKSGGLDASEDEKAFEG
jgi:hypothetical protein